MKYKNFPFLILFPIFILIVWQTFNKNILLQSYISRFSNNIKITQNTTLLYLSKGFRNKCHLSKGSRNKCHLSKGFRNKCHLSKGPRNKYHLSKGSRNKCNLI